MGLFSDPAAQKAQTYEMYQGDMFQIMLFSMCEKS